MDPIGGQFGGSGVVVVGGKAVGVVDPGIHLASGALLQSLSM